MPAPYLNRREVAPALLADRGDLLVVAGLGATAWDVASVEDHPLDFPLWGAMGGAAMVGLGLALAQPARRVLVIVGDGEMLMGLGSLATVAVEAPPNLAIVVLDNERYAETGMQQTHTGRGVDLEGIAGACGIPNCLAVRDEGGLDELSVRIEKSTGLIFAVAKVAANELPVALPPRDGPYLRSRFRHALLDKDQRA